VDSQRFTGDATACSSSAGCSWNEMSNSGQGFNILETASFLDRFNPKLFGEHRHNKTDTVLFIKINSLHTEKSDKMQPCMKSGFGGLEITCWPLVPKFAGSHPAEAVRFLGRKNPQHAILRRGSKAVGPMS
jgi:hypothetical protein